MGYDNPLQGMSGTIFTNVLAYKSMNKLGTRVDMKWQSMNPQLDLANTVKNWQSSSANLGSSGAESWYNKDGTINYPPNNGAVAGSEKIIELSVNKKLGRYGVINTKSDFLTQPGASADTLSLPPNTNPAIYQELIVLKPIHGVTQGTVAAWGGSSGGEIQYQLPRPIKWYQLNGYLSK